MQKCTGNFILNIAKELLGHFKYGDMIRQILRLRSPIKQEFYISVWGRGMVINFAISFMMIFRIFAIFFEFIWVLLVINSIVQKKNATLIQKYENDRVVFERKRLSMTQWLRNQKDSSFWSNICTFGFSYSSTY